jgi:hypothetical protein
MKPKFAKQPAGASLIRPRAKYRKWWTIIFATGSGLASGSLESTSTCSATPVTKPGSAGACWLSGRSSTSWTLCT